MNIRDIKEGDIFTVVACYFQVPDWKYYQPCVIFSPLLKYHETCSGSADSAIDDFLIDVVNHTVDSDSDSFVNGELSWVGKSLKSLKRSVRKSLKTGDKPFKSVYSEVIEMEVRIVLDKDGQLTWRVLKKREI